MLLRPQRSYCPPSIWRPEGRGPVPWHPLPPPPPHDVWGRGASAANETPPPPPPLPPPSATGHVAAGRTTARRPSAAGGRYLPPPHSPPPPPPTPSSTCLFPRPSARLPPRRGPPARPRPAPPMPTELPLARRLGASTRRCLTRSRAGAQPARGPGGADRPFPPPRPRQRRPRGPLSARPPALRPRGPGAGVHWKGRGLRGGPQRRLGRRLEGVAKAVGGGYCRLQMPLRLARGVRGTVAGRRLGALEGGRGGDLPPFQCIPGDGAPLQCRAGQCSLVHPLGPGSRGETQRRPGPGAFHAAPRGRGMRPNTSHGGAGAAPPSLWPHRRTPSRLQWGPQDVCVCLCVCVCVFRGPASAARAVAVHRSRRAPDARTSGTRFESRNACAMVSVTPRVGGRLRGIEGSLTLASGIARGPSPHPLWLWLGTCRSPAQLPCSVSGRQHPLRNPPFNPLAPSPPRSNSEHGCSSNFGQGRLTTLLPTPLAPVPPFLNASPPPPSPCQRVRPLLNPFLKCGGMSRDASEGKAPQRQPQKRFDRRLEEVATAVGGGYCRLQTPLRPALGTRGTVAGHRLGALEGGGGGGGYLPPSNASLGLRARRGALGRAGGQAAHQIQAVGLVVGLGHALHAGAVEAVVVHRGHQRLQRRTGGGGGGGAIDGGVALGGVWR